MSSAFLLPVPLPLNGDGHWNLDPETYRKLKSWATYAQSILGTMEEHIAAQRHRQEGLSASAEITEWTIVYTCVRDGYEQIFREWLATYTLYTSTLHRLSSGAGSGSSTISPSTTSSLAPVPAPAPAPFSALLPSAMDLPPKSLDSHSHSHFDVPVPPLKPIPTLAERNSVPELDPISFLRTPRHERKGKGGITASGDISIQDRIRRIRNGIREVEGILASPSLITPTTKRRNKPLPLLPKPRGILKSVRFS